MRAQRSEESGNFSPPTLQLGPSPLGLQFVRVRKGSDTNPATCDKWGRPRKPSVVSYELLQHGPPQEDLQTSRTVAKMHRSGWRICV